jgi:anti-sigma regulatory factor (Ser/Thr protein kinase)
VNADVSGGLVHPVLFYRDTDAYLAGTVPFIRAGIESGEPVAVAVPRPRLDAISDALGTDAARTTLIDMYRAGRNPGRIIASVLRAFVDQHPTRRTRIIGEPIWVGRSRTEYPACVQHEALINLAFVDRPVTILCPYDASALCEPVLADAETTHPLLVDADGERPSAGYDITVGMNVGNEPLPEPPAATELLFSIDSLRHAREYAVARARRVGLDDRRVLDVELIVSELISNSALHGGGRGSLRVFVDEGYLVCDVTNEGGIADPLAGRHPLPAQTGRGHGLLLVHQLADLVRVHTTPEATTVRAYVQIEPG